MNNNILYTHRTKLADIVAENSCMLSVLQRLNIKLGFGEATVAEACRRYNLSADLFLIISNIYSFKDYLPSVETLKPSDTVQLTSYLRASHRYYIGYMLPHVARHLDDILSHCDNLSRSLFSRFYNEYMSFLGEHFREEESEIFAIVEGVENNLTMDIGRLEAPHGDIDDRTNDLASLVIKSLPEAVPTTLRCQMLKDIYALRDDLRVHSRIEMHLLRPLVEKFLKTEER